MWTIKMVKGYVSGVADKNHKVDGLPCRVHLADTIHDAMLFNNYHKALSFCNNYVKQGSKDLADRVRIINLKEYNNAS